MIGKVSRQEEEEKITDLRRDLSAGNKCCVILKIIDEDGR